MSIFGVVQGAADVFQDLALFKPKRSIGGFTANVTISEHHMDDMEITEHPVEQGASITDHAFKRPSRVTIECGWSSSSLAGLLGAVGLGSQADIKAIYQNFQDLQASRQPFQIVTGKRLYTDMLIRSLSMTTDKQTENSLILKVDCQQILIVQTQVVTVPDSSVMANPEATAATQNSGTKHLAPGTAFNYTVTPI